MSADPLDAVLASAAALDALASGSAGSTGDEALDLLASLRGAIDLAAVHVSPVAVARDADLLDLIATGGMPAGGDPALVLLADLRATMDRRAAFTASAGPDELAARRRTALPRRAARVAVVAAGIGFAVMGTTGVAAATYSAHPGGTLYSLRTATFGRTDDDPVVDQELVAEIHQQVAAAQATPASAPAHLAAATAAYLRLQKIAPLVHDPVAARRIEASANAVHVSLAHTNLSARSIRLAGGARPIPSSAASGRSVAAGSGTSSMQRHAPGTATLAGRAVGLTASSPAGPPMPAPEPTPSVAAPQPSGPSAGPSPTPPLTSASSEPEPTGTTGSPTPSGPVSTSPSTSTSASGSPSTSSSIPVSASGSPTESTSPSAGSSVTPVPSRSTTGVVTAAPTEKVPPVKVRKVVKRKKVVTTTATLMSATVPATDASLRPNR